MSKHTDFVRTLPCAVSGYIGEETDCHHLVGFNWLTGKGMGLKGSDVICMPLRHSLHMELHQMGWKSFEEKHNFSQLEAVIDTIVKAEKAGVITI